MSLFKNKSDDPDKNDIASLCKVNQQCKISYRMAYSINKLTFSTYQDKQVLVLEKRLGD